MRMFFFIAPLAQDSQYKLHLWQVNLLSQIFSFRGFPIVALPNGVIINGYDGLSHASTPFAVFGNLKNAGAWIGTHGGMDIRISYDATVETVNAFANDLQLLRLTERLAFGVGQPVYLAVLSTSAIPCLGEAALGSTVAVAP